MKVLMEKKEYAGFRSLRGNKSFLKINRYLNGKGEESYNLALMIPKKRQRVNLDFFIEGEERLVFPANGKKLAEEQAYEIYYSIKSKRDFEKFVKKNQ